MHGLHVDAIVQREGETADVAALEQGLRLVAAQCADNRPGVRAHAGLHGKMVSAFPISALRGVAIRARAAVQTAALRSRG